MEQHISVERHIANLCRARFPMLYITTWEEERALKTLYRLVKDVEFIKTERTLFVWRITTGIEKIENELDILIKKLEEIMVLRIPPFKKLEVYLFTRFEAIKEVVYRNGSLKADFFKNIYEVEKARRPIDLKEIKMLRQIIDEGIADGSFKDVSSQWTAMFMLYAFKGLEAPYMNNSVSLHINERRILIMDVLLNGLMKDVENT